MKLSDEPMLEDEKYGLSNKEGIEVFKEILRNPSPQMLVSKSPVLDDSYKYIGNRNIQDMCNLNKPHAEDNSFLLSEKVDGKNILKSIWRDVFDVDVIDLNSNFFELGGDSLFAIQLCYQIKVRLKVDVEPAQLLEAPVFYDFWTYIVKQIN